MKKYDAKLTFILKEDGPTLKLDRPDLVSSYLEDAIALNPEQEQFWVIFLNRKNYPIGRLMITLGTATSCLAHPREVFRAAIMANSCAIICAHNHPSGDPAPSAADVQITRILREAAKVIDIQLLDHIILGDASCDPTGYGKGYYSFREAGLL
jgi:DNA repair protein RadC